MKKLLVTLLIGFIILTGCSQKTEEEPKEPEKTEYAVGETATVGDIKITLKSFRYLEGDAYFKPDEGTKWIAVEFTFENTGKESTYIAGIFDLTMKDSEGYEKEQNIWGDLNGSVDGNVLPSEKLSGEKSFVITGSEEKLYVYYKPTFSTKDPIKFIVE